MEFHSALFKSAHLSAKELIHLAFGIDASLGFHSALNQSTFLCALDLIYHVIFDLNSTGLHDAWISARLDDALLSALHLT